MGTFKNYIISIITITIVLKLGSSLLSKTDFSKLFKVLSGIILISYIIMSTSSCEQNKKFFSDLITPELNTEFKDYKNDFEDKLEELIKEDLHNKYYVNINIDVKTDLKSLTIYAKGDLGNQKIEEIKNYLLNTYCTPEDEVILINETT